MRNIFPSKSISCINYENVLKLGKILGIRKKMKNISYRFQVVSFVAWIVAVIFIFKFVQDKPTAGLIAGIGFLILPGLFLFAEIKGAKRVPHMAALCIFLAGSAIPIFLLRILNWGAEFSTLSLFGFSAEFLHRLSNYFYLVMLGSAIYHWRRSSLNSK